MERRLFLNVIVCHRAIILQLLARENESLLIRRDTLLVLDLRLDVGDCVARLNLERDGLSSECLDEDLHSFNTVHGFFNRGTCVSESP